MAHQILEGSDVSNLKTEGPKFPYSVINLKTFDLLEIEIPVGLEYGVREVVR